MRIVSWLTVGAVALAAGCASSNASISRDSTGTPHPATGGGPVATVNGRIRNYTRGPSGQMDGFVLASGQRVDVPEDLGSKALDRFPPNTEVQVTGRMTTETGGRTVVEADRITAPGRKATLDLTEARAAPPSPAWGPSIDGSGPGESQSVNPPDEPSTPGNPPPAGGP